MAELLEQIRQLSVQEQFDLVREIISDLEHETSSREWDEFSVEESTELRSRMAAFEANPLDTSDWKGVRAGIEA